jgi:hypothetical protein
MLVPFIIHSTSEQKVKRFLSALDVFINGQQGMRYAHLIYIGTEDLLAAAHS